MIKTYSSDVWPISFRRWCENKLLWGSGKQARDPCRAWVRYPGGISSTHHHPHPPILTNSLTCERDVTWEADWVLGLLATGFQPSVSLEGVGTSSTLFLEFYTHGLFAVADVRTYPPWVLIERAIADDLEGTEIRDRANDRKSCDHWVEGGAVAKASVIRQWRLRCCAMCKHACVLYLMSK